MRIIDNEAAEKLIAYRGFPLRAMLAGGKLPPLPKGRGTAVGGGGIRAPTEAEPRQLSAIYYFIIIK